MKKILSFLGVTILTYVPASLVVACNIGSLDGSEYLNSLSNFDWTNSEYGDGIDFNNINSKNILSNIGSDTELGNIKAQNSGHYLNYAKFNTGFQWMQNIKKQAVTGVPLNKGFMPNGNYVADFGITSAARKYLRMNSILDWNPNQDYDAKYNKAVVPLQAREFVATSNATNQDENINYNQLGFSTRKHRTFDNTIVGTKNPFENTMLNWQYTNNFINWSGSWFEGPIIPPPADVIDAAHINGTPIFGNVFLEGYHGLTKEMLKDFLAQDADGTYKIVNILINIAIYNGFDGWFINNEANGSSPNGTVLDYNVLYEIIKEFNYKVATANDKDINKLKLIFYRNGATLSKNSQRYYDSETLKMTQSGYVKPNGEITPTDIQTNFGQTPDKTTAFLAEHPNYSGQNLYTMNDAGANPKFFGTYDFRQLGYAETFSGGKPSYNKNVYNGFSLFLDNGVGTFGSYAYDWAKNNGVKSDVRAYLFAAQTTNLFNTIQFSGTNTFISNDDTGMQSNKFLNDYNGLNPSGSYQEAAFISDPRIKIDNKSKGTEDKFVKENIYNYQKNNGYNSSSYGIGSLVKEKTTLFDDNQTLNKKTNFSMGSGIKFVNRDQDGNAINANDYPWTNRRLSDILPTYQWKIYDNANPDQPLDIAKIAGFYDYDAVYQKGNSIAIGGGFNQEGKVENASWDPNTVYDWDIMGTNLTSNTHEISFVYNNGNNSDVSFLVTTTDQKSLISKRQPFPRDTVVNLKDGWVKITLNLNQLGNINVNNRISRLGLQIKPKNNDFKFNVGEFTINSPTTKPAHLDNTIITNPMAEYVINRTVNNQILSNVRFQWNATNIEELSYYAVYYFDEKKWYRVGETTQNCYFLKNLKNNNNTIKLMIKPVYHDNVMSQQAFIFNIGT